MSEILKKIFSNDTFGPKIGLFNIWHILILLLVVVGSFVLAYLLRNKSEETKKKILDIMTLVLVALYFFDFFIHPFMYGEDKLIVDKLPFHLCTGGALLIGLSRLWPKVFEKYKTSFVVLAFVGGMMYLTVPTALDGEYLICYRSLQTIIFHGLLFYIGIFSICFNDIKLEFKYIYRIAIVAAIMDLISVFANRAYGGIRGEGVENYYNWFFSTEFLGINQYLMPFVIFGVFFVMSVLIYLINFGVRKLIAKINAKKVSEEA